MAEEVKVDLRGHKGSIRRNQNSSLSIMANRIQLWVGQKWPKQSMDQLHKKLDPFCDFVNLPQDAEVVLVNDAADILELGTLLPPHILCFSLEKQWRVRSHEVIAVKLEQVDITLRPLYLFGLSRAGIALPPVD